LQGARFIVPFKKEKKRKEKKRKNIEYHSIHDEEK